MVLNGLCWLCKRKRLFGHVIVAIGAKYVIALSCTLNFGLLYLACTYNFIVYVKFIRHLLLLLAENETPPGPYAFFVFKAML